MGGRREGGGSLFLVTLLQKIGKFIPNMTTPYAGERGRHTFGRGWGGKKGARFWSHLGEESYFPDAAKPVP